MGSRGHKSKQPLAVGVSPPMASSLLSSSVSVPPGKEKEGRQAWHKGVKVRKDFFPCVLPPSFHQGEGRKGKASREPLGVMTELKWRNWGRGKGRESETTHRDGRRWTWWVGWFLLGVGCCIHGNAFFSPFLLKIYYKKCSWGRGQTLSLSVLRVGTGVAKTPGKGGRKGCHCRDVSPTISRPCCCSWARSNAFSFLSSSICCLRSSLSICSLSASLKVSCIRWLVWRSSRI